MRQFILFCAVMSLSGLLSAQKLKESEVPAAVQASFKKSFPNAKSAVWSKESENEFEAEFKNGALQQAANFDTAGKWLLTETEIKRSDLPSAVLAALKKDFAGYKTEEAEKVETSDNEMFYEVAMEKGETTVSLQISKEGKVLKKEEGEGGDEEDEQQGKKKKN